MKLLNMENGKQKMYIQLRDIAFLLHSDVKVPKSIYMVVLDHEKPLSEHKGTDFYEYTEPQDIEFLNGLDFIVDYKELRDMEVGELGMMITDIESQIRDVEAAYDTLTPEEKQNNRKYYHEIERLEYKKSGTKEIMEAMAGNISLDLPIVPDSDGFTLDAGGVFQISQSIDHDKILFHRKDSKELEPEDRPPAGLIQMGMSIVIADKKDDGIEKGNIETTTTLNPDGKYLITSVNMKKPPVQKEKEDKSILSKIKKVLGLN